MYNYTFLKFIIVKLSQIKIKLIISRKIKPLIYLLNIKRYEDLDVDLFLGRTVSEIVGEHGAPYLILEDGI